MCPELKLARLMAEDAKDIARRTAHWRCASKGAGIASSKGKLHPGSVASRVLAVMVAGRDYAQRDLADLAGAKNKDVGQVLIRLVRAGVVRRIDGDIPRFARAA